MGTSDGNGFGGGEEAPARWSWFSRGDGVSWVIEEGSGPGDWNGNNQFTSYDLGRGAGSLDY